MEAEMSMADILLILLVTIGPITAAILFVKLTASGSRDFQRAVAIRMVRVAMVVCLVSSLPASTSG